MISSQSFAAVSNESSGIVLEIYGGVRRRGRRILGTYVAFQLQDGLCSDIWTCALETFENLVQDIVKLHQG